MEFGARDGDNQKAAHRLQQPSNIESLNSLSSMNSNDTQGGEGLVYGVDYRDVRENHGLLDDKFMSAMPSSETDNNRKKLEIEPIMESRLSDLDSDNYLAKYASPSKLFFPQELVRPCEILEQGLEMTKVTRKKKQKQTFCLRNKMFLTWRNGAKKLNIDSIKDIRVDNMARNYREEYGVHESVADRWVTIIYKVGIKLKALHVIATNKEDFNVFSGCMRGLTRYRVDLMKSISLPDNEKFANIHWHTCVSTRKEDESRDTLSFGDVKYLCDRFNIFYSSSQLHTFFMEADRNKNGLLNFDEFQTFVRLLKTRDEVLDIWNEVNGNKKYMTFKTFKNFLKDVQKEYLEDDKLKLLFKSFARNNKTQMDVSGFIEYLTCQPYSKKIVTDYSKPLNNYFVASSHNTYLLGKQYGESPSVEGYIEVLQQGCRCIEIDVWDGEKGPEVCHGFLTSSIPLNTVVDVIRKYAFFTSPYPLIISLENNCNDQNQLILMTTFRDVFGDILYLWNDETNDKLPSPEELKHKVLLKIKKTRKGDLPKINRNPINSSASSQFENSSSSFSATDGETALSQIPLSDSAASKTSSLLNKGLRKMKVSKQIHTNDKLLSLAGLHGLKFTNFSLPESKTPSHCFSLNERKVETFCKDENHQLSFDKHNRRYLMRIYPHAFRYHSSNFNPIKFWALGCQMVATNWQTYDLGHQLNLALFQLSDHNQGSNSGYVLKPPNLLPIVSKRKEIVSVYKRFSGEPKKITLQILSAQLIPREKSVKAKENTLSPYVTIEYFSNEELLEPLTIENGNKISATECSTFKCRGNGFNPIWKSEATLKLSSVDFAFIRFSIKTDDKLLASTCVKLSYLRQGYRHIPLYNAKGERHIFSSLFIYVNIS